MKNAELVAEVFKSADSYFEEQNKLCAITEIEKIKEELLDLYYQPEYDAWASYEVYMIINLLDSHISKLKGND